MRASAGKLFVISSPSGGGKNTVIDALLKRDTDLRYAVSATTRPPRKGEKDGVDYFFWDEERFRRKVEEGAFVEWAEVYGYYYGTLREQVDRHLKEGKHVLLDLDVQGGLRLKQLMPEAVLIFLLPPSMEVLEERLRRRGTEDAEVLAKRLRIAREEMEVADAYDFQIINDRLEEAVDGLQAIIQKRE